MDERKAQQGPLFAKLRWMFLQKIASGEWRYGGQIPNEHDLAAEHGASLGTVRKALDQLEEDNFIVRKQGVGTFVVDPSGNEVSSRYERLRMDNGSAPVAVVKLISTSVEPCPPELARALAISSRDTIWIIRRTRAIETDCFLYEEITLPTIVFSKIQTMDPQSFRLSIAAMEHGLLLGEALERLTAVPCPEYPAAALAISQGDPVMRVQSRVFTIDGRPVCLRDGYLVTRAIHYSVSLNRR